MTKASNFRYLKHTEINSEKWNRCIDNSPNVLIYSYSWYLNLVCNEWDALVLGDYDYVMPIPIRRKFGYSYVYQPYFAQQLGIFPIPSHEIQEYFSSKLIKLYRFIDYQLNAEMSENSFSKFKLNKRTNYVLSLNNCYNSISKKYTSHTRRNISKAEQNNITVSTELSTEEYFNNFESRYPIPPDALNQLRELIKYSKNKATGELYVAYSNKIVCAAVFFLRSKKRVVLLNSFSNEQGRENRSIFAIVDKFIQNNSNSALSLDFEGSNKEGLARFYKGFGAGPEYYHHISSYTLPRIIKLFKK